MSSILVDNLTGKTTAGNVTVTSEGGAKTMQLQQGLCKAWMDYRGVDTVAINDSLNIASVLDSGVGRYDPSFTNVMNSANYSSALGTSGGHILTENHAVHETGKFYLSCGNSTFGSFNDHGSVHVQINGDLA